MKLAWENQKDTSDKPWDCCLVRDGETVQVEEKHRVIAGQHTIRGSVYTYDAYLCVSRNYDKYWIYYFGADLEYTLDQKSAADSLVPLATAISLMKEEEGEEGEARRVLCNLLQMALMVPADSVWWIS